MTTHRMVLAGAAANAGVGSLFAWSLVADEVAADVGLTIGGTAAVFAAAIAVMATTAVATGTALGSTSPRALLVGAALAAGSGLLLASWWPDPVGLTLGVSGLFGAANGVAYSVAATLGSWVPHRRRGAATGVIVAAYATPPVLLGVVGPPVIAEHGWRLCMLALGGVASGLLLLAAVLAPVAPPHRARTGTTGGAGEAPARTVAWLWLLFASATAPALMVFAHAVALADLRGLDARTAGLTVSVLAGGNLLGRILAGWVSDAVGRWPSLAVVVAAQVAALGAVVWGGAPALVGGFAVLGFCYGAVSALVPAATADLVGVAAFARSYPRVFSGWGVAGLTSPILGAGLVGLAAVTPAALLLAALPLLTAGLALWALSRPASLAAARRASAVGEVRGGQDQL